MSLQTRLEYLFSRYGAGTCTAAERAELMELAILPEHEASIKAWIDASLAGDIQKEAPGFLALSDERAGELFESIVQPAIPVHRVSFLRRYWAVAAAILVLATGTYLWFITSPRHVSQPPLAQEIAPGKDGAILTLADGRQLVLDSLSDGVIASQSGAQLSLSNGQLVYGAVQEEGHGPVYNTISTPKGRQFKVQLSDGTTVWLNAGSSIKYPAIFTGNARQVTVTGEAYFEVTKHKKMPFFVTVGNKAAIEVLGTRFNVNAYDNEGSVNTTLLEGSIRTTVLFSGAQGKAENVILRPGQQARIPNRQDNSLYPPAITVLEHADIDKVMAWKNGIFNFEGASLEEVMKQLERWYDIEVVFEKGVPQKRLIGKMTRDINLNGLLAGLQELGIHCRLEGRKLIVLP